MGCVRCGVAGYDAVLGVSAPCAALGAAGDRRGRHAPRRACQGSKMKNQHCTEPLTTNSFSLDQRDTRLPYDNLCCVSFIAKIVTVPTFLINTVKKTGVKFYQFRNRTFETYSKPRFIASNILRS